MLRQQPAILAFAFSSAANSDKITITGWKWLLYTQLHKPKTYTEHPHRKLPDKIWSNAWKFVINTASLIQPWILFGVSICPRKGEQTTKPDPHICYTLTLDLELWQNISRTHDFVRSNYCAAKLVLDSYSFDNDYYWRHATSSNPTQRFQNKSKNTLHRSQSAFILLDRLSVCAWYCTSVRPSYDLYREAYMIRYQGQTTAIHSTHALSGHFLVIQSAWLIQLYLAYRISSSKYRIYGSHLTATILTKASRVLSQGSSKLSLQRISRHCDISSPGYIWISVSLALTSEGVHSELTTARHLTKTTSYQEKLDATNWYYICWIKRIASKFTELRLIGLVKFSRFRGSVTKQQIFYIWGFF